MLINHVVLSDLKFDGLLFSFKRHFLLASHFLCTKNSKSIALFVALPLFFLPQSFCVHTVWVLGIPIIYGYIENRLTYGPQLYGMMGACAVYTVLFDLCAIKCISILNIQQQLISVIYPRIEKSLALWT